MRPVLLDLYSGAGGAAMGYHRAGWQVVGVDIEPQPNYPFEFKRADAIEILAALVRNAENGRVDCRFHAIHASPPCQRDSRMTRCRPGLAATYASLVPVTRELLKLTGLPYVLEQPEHGTPLVDPVTLCGWMFGYETYRHRCFETGNGFILPIPPRPGLEAGPGPLKSCGWPHPVPAAKAGHWTPGHFVSVAGHERVGLTRPVMDIDWTNREELAEAIPPYMTEWVGRALHSTRERGAA